LIRLTFISEATQSFHIALLGGLPLPNEPAVEFKTTPDSPIITSIDDTIDVTNVSSSFIPRDTGVEKNGLRVELPTQNDALHVFQPFAVSDIEGYLAIADDDLGTEYYVSTYCPNDAICQFAVTPVFDDTSLCITLRNGTSTPLTCSGTGLTTGSSDVPCHLDEFDVMYIQSSEDLSGSRIIADKKVAVFVGAINVEQPPNMNRHRLIEQIPPVSKWGTRFVVASSGKNVAGEMIKIVTQASDTHIYINGFSPFIIPNEGQSVERKIDSGITAVVEASKPVLILQIFGTLTLNTSSMAASKPAMVNVLSVNQWTNSSYAPSWTGCTSIFSTGNGSNPPTLELALQTLYSICDNGITSLVKVLWTAGSIEVIQRVHTVHHLI